MDDALDAPGTPGAHESSAFNRAVHPEDVERMPVERWYDPWPVKLMLFGLVSIMGVCLTGGTWIVKSAVTNETKDNEQDQRLKAFDEKWAGLDRKLDKIDDKLDEMRKK